MPYRINLLFHRYLKLFIHGLAKLSSVGEFKIPMKEQINESCNAQSSAFLVTFNQSLIHSNVEFLKMMQN